MFGPHLTLDLYGCNKEKLNDFNFIYSFLNELPHLLGVHKFSDPQVTIIPPQSNSFDKGGLTGFVILVESHITIHTFPADEFASVDIFSCKDFSISKATDYITEKFEAKKAEKNFVERGRSFVKHYPRSVGKAKQIALKERKKI